MPVTTHTGRIRQAVLAAYSAYFADFQRPDRGAVAAYFTAPLCRVKNGMITVFATEADVQKMLREGWASLAAKDYGRASITSTTITVLDDRTALLRGRGPRYNRAGDPFEQFDVLYTFVRADNGSEWKIAVLTSIAADGS